MYLKPEDLASRNVGHTVFDDCVMEPNVEAAMTIMNEHYQKIDVAQVRTSWPMGIPNYE